MTVEALLVDAVEAARLCGVSRSHWLSLHSSGRVPLPQKLGNRTLWSVAELRSWIAVGTPRQEVWEQRKEEKLKLQSQQDKWYRNRNIQAALIISAITIVGWFVTPYINKQVAPPQKTVSTAAEMETTGNLSPAVVTSGPNSPVNIYLTPSQSETRSEVSETDVNRPKSLSVKNAQKGKKLSESPALPYTCISQTDEIY